MGGQSIIACFNGDQVLRGRLGDGKIMGPLHLLKEKPGRALERIKLKRSMVHACATGKSGVFSLRPGLDGERAIIWCTDDHKQFLQAFEGILCKVSNHPGNCKYVLKPERELSKQDWESLKQKP